MAASTTRSAARSERDVLADVRGTLRQRADVLNVRLGWVFRDGWITTNAPGGYGGTEANAGRVARGGP